MNKILIESKCGRSITVNQTSLILDQGVWYIIDLNSDNLLVLSIKESDIKSISRV